MAVSVAAQQQPKKLHDTNAHLSRQQIINEATKANIEKLNKIKAQLEQCIKEGSTCTVETTLIRRYKKEEKVIKAKKAAVNIQIDAAQARGTVQYYKQHLKEVKKADKKDEARIKLYKHDLRVARRDQERVRLRQERALAKKIKREERRMKRQHRRVVKCEHQPERRGCKKLLKKYGQEKAKTLRMKQQRRKLEKKIAVCRQNHARTFQKVKSVQVKKAIILNRYNVKKDYIEKRIQKIEKRLRRLSKRRRTRRVVRRYRRTQRKLKYWRSRLVSIKREERRTLRLKSSGPGDCDTCEDAIHEILNEIHLNLVFHTKSGETVVKRVPKFKIIKGHRKVLKSRWVKRPVTTYREEERTGKRTVMRDRKVKKLRRWTSKRRVRRRHTVYRDNAERYQHTYYANQTIRVPHKVVKNERVKVLKKWFTMEKRKVKVPIVGGQLFRVERRNFTRLRRVQKIHFKKVVKQVPTVVSTWVTKKVLVMKPKVFRRQSLEYVKDANGTGYYHWVDMGVDKKMVPTWVDNKVLEKKNSTKQVVQEIPVPKWEEVPETYSIDVKVPLKDEQRFHTIEKPVKVWHQKWVWENRTKHEIQFKDHVQKSLQSEWRTRIVKRKHHVYKDEDVVTHHSKLEDVVEKAPVTETYKYKVKVPHRSHKMVQENYQTCEEFEQKVPVEEP